MIEPVIKVGVSVIPVGGGTGSPANPYTGWQAAFEAMPPGSAVAFEGGKIYGFNGTLKLRYSPFYVYGNFATLKCLSATGAFSLTCTLTAQTHRVGVLIAEPLPGFEQYGFNENTDVHVRDLHIDANGIAHRGIFIANQLDGTFKSLKVRNALIWSIVTRRFISNVAEDWDARPWNGGRELVATPVNGIWFGEHHPSSNDDHVTVCVMNRIRAHDHLGQGIRLGNTFGNTFNGGHASLNNQNLYLGADSAENIFNGTDFELNAPITNPGAPPPNTADPTVTGPIPSIVHGKKNNFQCCNAIDNDFTFEVNAHDSVFRNGVIRQLTHKCTGLDVRGTAFAMPIISTGTGLLRDEYIIPYGVHKPIHIWDQTSGAAGGLRVSAVTPGVELIPTDGVNVVPWNGIPVLDAAKCALVTLDYGGVQRAFTNIGDYNAAVACPTGRFLMLGERGGASSMYMHRDRVYQRVQNSAPSDGNIQSNFGSLYVDGNDVKIRVRKNDGTMATATLGTLA